MEVASGGEEEGHEGGAVAERVVHAKNADGGGLGRAEVEKVDVPEGIGGVDGGGAEAGYVVFDEIFRRVHGGVQFWDCNVVFYIHLGSNPPNFSAIFLICNLNIEEEEEEESNIVI